MYELQLLRRILPARHRGLVIGGPAKLRQSVRVEDVHRESARSEIVIRGMPESPASNSALAPEGTAWADLIHGRNEATTSR